MSPRQLSWSHLFLRDCRPRKHKQKTRGSSTPHEPLSAAAVARHCSSTSRNRHLHSLLRKGKQVKPEDDSGGDGHEKSRHTHHLLQADCTQPQLTKPSSLTGSIHSCQVASVRRAQIDNCCWQCGQQDYLRQRTAVRACQPGAGTTRASLASESTEPCALRLQIVTARSVAQPIHGLKSHLGSVGKLHRLTRGCLTNTVAIVSQHDVHTPDSSPLASGSPKCGIAVGNCGRIPRSASQVRAG
jgi:hypothetical protein